MEGCNCASNWRLSCGFCHKQQPPQQQKQTRIMIMMPATQPPSHSPELELDELPNNESSHASHVAWQVSAASEQCLFPSHDARATVLRLRELTASLACEQGVPAHSELVKTPSHLQRLGSLYWAQVVPERRRDASSEQEALHESGAQNAMRMTAHCAVDLVRLDMASLRRHG